MISCIYFSPFVRDDVYVERSRELWIIMIIIIIVIIFFSISNTADENFRSRRLHWLVVKIYQLQKTGTRKMSFSSTYLYFFAVSNLYFCMASHETLFIPAFEKLIIPFVTNMQSTYYISTSKYKLLSHIQLKNDIAYFAAKLQ